tara:strand:+ start:142 stop:657 length:516 start_codon:yes stop_codon:yes gene_type:complete
MTPDELQQAVTMLQALDPEGRAQALNGFLSGYDKQIGVQFTRVENDRIEGYCDVTKEHLQVFGLVHGGVYASLAETFCSTGGAFSVMSEGKNVVGRSNFTKFLKAARSTTRLLIEAQPLDKISEGIVSWQCKIHDGEGLVFAESTVELNILRPDHLVGGKQLKLHQSGPKA